MLFFKVNFITNMTSPRDRQPCKYTVIGITIIFHYYFYSVGHRSHVALWLNVRGQIMCASLWVGGVTRQSPCLVHTVNPWMHYTGLLTIPFYCADRGYCTGIRKICLNGCLLETCMTFYSTNK